MQWFQAFTLCTKTEQDLVVIVILHEGKSNEVMHRPIRLEVAIAAIFKHLVHDGCMNSNHELRLWMSFRGERLLKHVQVQCPG
jgi:hypothetical protein